MNLGPDVWGPHGWKFLHLIALAYPDNPSNETKKRYKEFFMSLKYVLPCSICSENYRRHIEYELPLNNKVLKSRDSLVRWTIDIHNIVNKENGKKELSYDEAMNLILNNYNTNLNNNNKNINTKTNKTKLYSLCGLFFIFICLVAIAIIYKKN